MPYVIERELNRFEELSGGFQSGHGEDAVNHPVGWLAAATSEELATAGVEVVESALIPEGKLLVGTSYARKNGRVMQVLDLEDAPLTVPASVTPRQLRLALLVAGKLDQVEAFVTGGKAPPEAVISWEYATEFLRSDPMLNQLAAVLQPPLGEAEIDQLFVTAAQIQ